ncbi:hypothetical protein C8Q79DRAFT_1071722 [Trametes meyenii]|nr:hypothetical protein C8Q79DRAFT_1071722 [Trametes meyenii]
MWVEVGTQFARRWRAFFTRLERCHRLDPEKPGHLWLLHQLFLEEINVDCRAFQREWNHHPISGNAHNQTPVDMRLLSRLEHGVLPVGDDLNDVDPKLLSRYYGVDGPERHRYHGQTGAGHSDTESDADTDSEMHEHPISGSDRSTGNGSFSPSPEPSDYDNPSTSASPDELEENRDLDGNLTADQQRHIRHPPIPVPSSGSPFRTKGFEDVMAACLHEVVTSGIVPDGYGVTEADRDLESCRGENPDEEIIALGRGGRRVSILLPAEIWRRRAVLWAQGLDTMTQLLIVEEGV